MYDDEDGFEFLDDYMEALHEFQNELEHALQFPEDAIWNCADDLTDLFKKDILRFIPDELLKRLNIIKA